MPLSVKPLNSNVTLGTATGGTPRTVSVSSPAPTSSLSVVRQPAGYGNVTTSPQNAGMYNQPTYSPQTTAGIPAYYGGGGGSVLGASTTGFTGGAGDGSGAATTAATAEQVAAQQAAAAQAARVAQANALKGSITGLIGNIKGVYDAIYGDVNNVAADRTGQVDKAHSQDVQSLTGQFNNAFPAIGQGYAARGTYDSSYRGDAEKVATDEFGNAIGQLDSGYKADLAGIGQFVSKEQANVNSQKGGLDAISQQIADSQNPDELTTLRNTLDERLRSLTASRADLGTQGSYLQRLNSAVPVQNRLAPLQQTLTNVVSSAVPAPIKKAIAAQIVQQSGISGDETKKLLDQINSQIDASAGVA